MSDFNSRHNRAVWFDIPVAQLERAIAFYGAVLGVPVHREQAGTTEFAVLDHRDGNGGCLIPNASAAGGGGILVYFNAEGRIRDAVAQALRHGGRLEQPVHAIGPHGYRAIVFDSEGNRIALHSSVDA